MSSTKPALRIETLALLVPWLLVAALALATAVDVPYHDQWDMVPLIAKMRAGTLSASDLLERHYEHRIAVSRVLHLGLAAATGWDLRAEIALNLLLSLASLPALLGLVRRLVRAIGIGATFRFELVASLLLFSLVQWENYVWGFETGWFITTAAVLSVLVLLLRVDEGSTPRWLGFAGAFVAAAIATFSLAPGLILWLVAAILMALRPGLRRLLAIWLPAAGLVWWGYFAGSETSFAITPSLAAPFGRRVAYALVCLGRPLVPDTGQLPMIGSAIVGATLLVLFAALAAYCWRRYPAARGPLAAWISLGSYGILTACAMAVGRAGYGLEQALASRYTTSSIELAIATAVLAMIVGVDRVRVQRRAITLAATTLFVLLYAGTTAWGIARVLSHRERLAAARTCFDSGIHDCVPDVYRNKEPMYERAQYLEEIGWGGFTRARRSLPNGR
jgi:hypothetical protein